MSYGWVEVNFCSNIAHWSISWWWEEVVAEEERKIGNSSALKRLKVDYSAIGASLRVLISTMQLTNYKNDIVYYTENQ